MKKLYFFVGLFTGLMAQSVLAQNIAQLPDSAFVEVIQLDNTIVLDIRYATTNNFMKKAVYDCAKCLLRKEVAQALVAANAELKKKGYRIKIFDGYRPQSVQWKLWEITPNKNYVSDPRKGSMHNRGCAVDLTLVNEKGEEVDMGTPYDFFGKQAHIDYYDLPKEVLANRKFLAQVLTKYGFGTIRTEWWHFSYRKKIYPLSDHKFCP